MGIIIVPTSLRCESYTSQHHSTEHSAFSDRHYIRGGQYYDHHTVIAAAASIPTTATTPGTTLATAPAPDPTASAVKVNLSTLLKTLWFNLVWARPNS